jgi:predicted TIM-barrel fold metal-dependent hydrolase
VQNFQLSKFLVLNYAHKKGVAPWLNKWTYDFCSEEDRKGIAIPFGTIHPEDEKKSEQMDIIFGSYGFEGLKLQLMVTDFHIWDKRMDTVYKKIIDYNKVLMPHIGTGPSYSNFHPGKTIECPFVGVKHLRKFLKNYPEMKIIVPHLGAAEYEEMWRLIEEYPNLYFDTAMIGVKNNPAFDDGLGLISNERFYNLADRLLFGSDFPNIPYGYHLGIEGWLDRGMKKDFYEKLFYSNAKKLFNL